MTLTLYAVRDAVDQQAVGFFWVHNIDQLIDSIDAVTDPSTCEYKQVKEIAAVYWGERAPPLGVEVASELDENHADKLKQFFAGICNNVTFDFALEEFLNEDVTGWILLFADKETEAAIAEARARLKAEPETQPAAEGKRKPATVTQLPVGWNERRLRHLVDLVWNEATESKAAPSTETTDRLIASALAANAGK